MEAICPKCHSNQISVTVEVRAIFQDGEVETQGDVAAPNDVLSCDACCYTSFTHGKQEWIDAALGKYEMTYGKVTA